MQLIKENEYFNQIKKTYESIVNECKIFFEQHYQNIIYCINNSNEINSMNFIVCSFSKIKILLVHNLNEYFEKERLQFENTSGILKDILMLQKTAMNKTLIENMKINWTKKINELNENASKAKNI
ncbi:hypothetical protein TCON_0445 [Astathelohania contejeani]|uniref:Uncharacterized protein n=1 Tax=Astathelohania contejeani TaxID=164912 RepID=A0ABQ7I1Q7_9MICR|nr:hypothetical protein TCON_0445 [Thelohania contejeani]